ncbi:MAG TPA: methionyl-tRNA formyltransferase [Bacteroidales bacterium]|nr:methionyl-tRNA formyltransferase [Bacteroidales bacterium]
MRIVFFGTPDFAVETLKAVYKTKHEVAAVVTAPDKPAGRGRKLRISAVKEYALEHSLPVLQPTNLKSEDFSQQLKEIAPDIQIIVAFRMLPEKVWNLPPKGTFNIHASLLPQYRGAAPINHAIINGEKETGVTSFFLTKEIDTGSIIGKKKVLISEYDDAGSLHDKLMLQGAELAVETLNQIDKGTANPIPQNTLIENAEKLKKAPKIFKDNCRIDWEQGAEIVYNFIRGLSPYPAAFTYLSDNEGFKKQLKIFKTSKEYVFNVYETKSLFTDGKTYLKVACADGLISIEELQLEGKKRMDTESFLRGTKVSEKWTVE